MGDDVKKPKSHLFSILLIISAIIFLLACLLIVFGKSFLDDSYEIGVRLATVFVAFASFCSTTSFSYLVYLHNKSVNKANQDANSRAEMFRDLQFASDNYSIIEFMDRMLIYEESPRYVEKYIKNHSTEFHMFESTVKLDDVLARPQNYRYLSLKIPFKVVEGKLVASIYFEQLKFERSGVSYIFVSGNKKTDTRAYLLYNENTKRKNVIVNLVIPKNSDFFFPDQINVFSKIKMNILITSLLGVEVRGVSELYFTNPEQKEGDGSNTYNITSSNFTLSSMPTISLLHHKENNNIGNLKR